MSIQNPLIQACEIPEHRDGRGRLYVVESAGKADGFDIKRAFWITDVPKGVVRGEHANRCCTELLVPLRGSLRLWLTDGQHEAEILLDDPTKAIRILPMVWCRLWDFSDDVLLLCLADTTYDRATYINDYRQFLDETATRNDQSTAPA